MRFRDLLLQCGSRFMKIPFKMTKIFQYYSIAFSKVLVDLSVILTKENYSIEFYQKIILLQVRNIINLIMLDVESNGVAIFEFLPKKWYFFAIEHERPFMTRP
jgi:hypothetical protein